MKNALARFACLLALLLGACAHRPVPAAIPAPVGLADHHVHAFSPPVSRWLQTELDLPQLPPLDSGQLLAVMEKDGVDRAAVFSNAYFFGHGTDKQPADVDAMRKENDRIGDVVDAHRGRLVGFFGIDPLADSAPAEIERCANRGSFAGVKLHLANAGVDLRDPAHVERLADVFRRANARGLAIAIHLRTQRADYGREDAQIFIDRVLSQAPDVAVQVAHLGGWGGYDHATDAALGAFVDRVAHRQVGQDHVYFDISAVVRGVAAAKVKTGARDSSTGTDWWPEHRYARLAGRLRALGLERILFGSDWPEWTPQGYAADLRKNVPLQPDELQRLLSNRAPWLEQAGRGTR